MEAVGIGRVLEVHEGVPVVLLAAGPAGHEEVVVRPGEAGSIAGGKQLLLGAAARQVLDLDRGDALPLAFAVGVRRGGRRAACVRAGGARGARPAAVHRLLPVAPRRGSHGQRGESARRVRGQVKSVAQRFGRGTHAHRCGHWVHAAQRCGRRAWGVGRRFAHRHAAAGHLSRQAQAWRRRTVRGQLLQHLMLVLAAQGQQALELRGQGLRGTVSRHHLVRVRKLQLGGLVSEC
mmetsp:Transcript_63263/g.162779  ORF Transcript_63263/g.162779 Transcript_63263/m.162779 type:complete len:234 (+) Transcript_63263:245-946(+)